MRLQAAVNLYAGGQGSGCQGPNCGRPVGNTPDHTGKIPVPADIARQGAEHAEKLQSVSRNLDHAISQSVSVGYNKSGGRRSGPKAYKEMQEAEKAKSQASNAYHAMTKQTDDFEKKNGLSVVQAWEAHHDQNWPYYKVNTSGAGRTHYVPK